AAMQLDLRGTAATKFYIAGLPIRMIAEILAWSEDQVGRIIRRYIARAAATKEAIRQLNEASKKCGLSFAQLLRRRAFSFYRIDPKLRVLLTNLRRRLDLRRIERCLRLLKVLKGEQDYALRWLAFDGDGPAAAREIRRAIIQNRF